MNRYPLVGTFLRPHPRVMGWAAWGRPEIPVTSTPWLMLSGESDDRDEGALRPIIGENRLKDGEPSRPEPDTLVRRRQWAGKLPLPPPRSFS